ncbi:36888_t:CDS:2 [Gigaspora margarita]|uniref:36888_t:CDS:1 n=1 Tax=Gigaspora margarita TaxID=4874 RepID=A0ABN7VJ78_GIGMA|nr:36888_t:CDS:2 [Gigaspora margarita]
MLIWNDFSEGEEDGLGHLEQEKWQHGKPSIMKAHLALHCKGPVPDEIRRKWLIVVAKRGERVNNDKDDEISIGKKSK